MTRSSIVCSILLLMLFLGSAAASAADHSITVEGMHCGGCAQKIVARLKAVPHVEEVQADVSKSLITVHSGDLDLPSPRAMWEAVENAGYTPKRLAGPTGEFFVKPRS